MQLNSVPTGPIFSLLLNFFIVFSGQSASLLCVSFDTVDELMSLAVGAVSSSRNMGFDENKEGTSGEKTTHVEGHDVERLGRQMSDTSFYATDHDEEDEEGSHRIQPGPQYTLKEQLEKDKVCSFYIFQHFAVSYSIYQHVIIFKVTLCCVVLLEFGNF